MVLLCAWATGCAGRKENPLLTTPAFLLETLGPPGDVGLVMATPPLADPLRRAGANLADPARTRQAVQSAAAFRGLDRDSRLSVVVLSGPPATYRPVLQYLLEAPDWTLLHVDHMTLCFGRAGRREPWSPGRIDVMANRLQLAERSGFLAAVGILLVEAHRAPDARLTLERAMALGDRALSTVATLALVDARQQRWEDALKRAEAVIEKDPQHPVALYVKGQAYFALGRHADAVRMGETLLRKYPTDPQYLLLHAKSAHGVGDFEAEISSLRKLIGQMQSQGLPPAAYRIYLGQALSARHDPEGALREFEAALAEGGLTSNQTQFARSAVDRLRDGAR